jgi:serine/threonine-protein kinase
MSGRLLNLRIEPPHFSEFASGSQPFDWQRLFAAAGLDSARLQVAEPKWTPPMAFDTVAAWTGAYPELPELPIHVEAALWRGRPVFFQISGSWTDPALPRRTGVATAELVVLTVFVILTVFALWIARRNLRLGRGDRSGALRTASVMFALQLAGTTIAADYTEMTSDVNRFLLWTSFSLTFSAAFWIAYIALEPLIRRRWPQTMVVWSRLIGGRVMDTLVARDVLIGVTSAVALNLAVSGRAAVAGPLESLYDPSLLSLLGWRQAIGQWIGLMWQPILIAFFGLLLLFLLRILVRRDWLAGALMATFLTAVSFFQTEGGAIRVLLLMLQFGGATALLLRYGILAFLSFVAAGTSLSAMPFTLDFAAWYGKPSVVVFALLSSVALTACWIAVRRHWSLPDDLT